MFLLHSAGGEIRKHWGEGFFWGGDGVGKGGGDEVEHNIMNQSSKPHLGRFLAQIPQSFVLSFPTSLDAESSICHYFWINPLNYFLLKFPLPCRFNVVREVCVLKALFCQFSFLVSEYRLSPFLTP